MYKAATLICVWSILVLSIENYLKLLCLNVYLGQFINYLMASIPVIIIYSGTRAYTDTRGICKSMELTKSILFISVFTISVIIGVNYIYGYKLNFMAYCNRFCFHYLVIAFWEELIFRKISIDFMCKSNMQAHFMIITNSVFFACAHLVSFVIKKIDFPFIITNLLSNLNLGVLTTSYYLHNKSLICCVLIHGTFNCLVEIVLVEHTGTVLLMYYLMLIFLLNEVWKGKYDGSEKN